MATALTVTWSLGQVELRVMEAIWYRYRRRVGSSHIWGSDKWCPEWGIPWTKVEHHEFSTVSETAFPVLNS